VQSVERLEHPRREEGQFWHSLEAAQGFLRASLLVALKGRRRMLTIVSPKKESSLAQPFERNHYHDVSRPHKQGREEEMSKKKEETTWHVGGLMTTHKM
jgi:hypothetical protein